MEHSFNNPFIPEASVHKCIDGTFEIHLYLTGIVTNFEVTPFNELLLVSGFTSPQCWADSDEKPFQVVWTDQPYGHFARDIPTNLSKGSKCVVLETSQRCSTHIVRYAIRNHTPPTVTAACHTGIPIPASQCTVRAEMGMTCNDPDISISTSQGFPTDHHLRTPPESFTRKSLAVSADHNIAHNSRMQAEHAGHLYFHDSYPDATADPIVPELRSPQSFKECVDSNDLDGSFNVSYGGHSAHIDLDSPGTTLNSSQRNATIEPEISEQLKAAVSIPSKRKASPERSPKVTKSEPQPDRTPSSGRSGLQHSEPVSDAPEPHSVGYFNDQLKYSQDIKPIKPGNESSIQNTPEAQGSLPPHRVRFSDQVQVEYIHWNPPAIIQNIQANQHDPSAPDPIPTLDSQKRLVEGSGTLHPENIEDPPSIQSPHHMVDYPENPADSSGPSYASVNLPEQEAVESTDDTPREIAAGSTTMRTSDDVHANYVRIPSPNVPLDENIVIDMRDVGHEEDSSDNDNPRSGITAAPIPVPRAPMHHFSDGTSESQHKEAMIGSLVESSLDPPKSLDAEVPEEHNALQPSAAGNTTYVDTSPAKDDVEANTSDIPASVPVESGAPVSPHRSSTQSPAVSVDETEAGATAIKRSNAPVDGPQHSSTVATTDLQNHDRSNHQMSEENFSTEEAFESPDEPPLDTLQEREVDIHLSEDESVSKQQSTVSERDSVSDLTNAHDVPTDHDSFQPQHAESSDDMTATDSEAAPIDVPDPVYNHLMIGGPESPHSPAVSVDESEAGAISIKRSNTPLDDAQSSRTMPTTDLQKHDQSNHQRSDENPYTEEAIDGSDEPPLDTPQEHDLDLRVSEDSVVNQRSTATNWEDVEVLTIAHDPSTDHGSFQPRYAESSGDTEATETEPEAVIDIPDPLYNHPVDGDIQPSPLTSVSNITKSPISQNEELQSTSTIQAGHEFSETLDGNELSDLQDRNKLVPLRFPFRSPIRSPSIHAIGLGISPSSQLFSSTSRHILNGLEQDDPLVSKNFLEQGGNESAEHAERSSSHDMMDSRESQVHMSAELLDQEKASDILLGNSRDNVPVESSYNLTDDIPFEPKDDDGEADVTLVQNDILAAVESGASQRNVVEFSVIHDVPNSTRSLERENFGSNAQETVKASTTGESLYTFSPDNGTPRPGVFQDLSDATDPPDQPVEDIPIDQENSSIAEHGGIRYTYNRGTEDQTVDNATSSDDVFADGSDDVLVFIDQGVFLWPEAFAYRSGGFNTDEGDVFPAVSQELLDESMDETLVEREAFPLQIPRKLADPTRPKLLSTESLEDEIVKVSIETEKKTFIDHIQSFTHDRALSMIQLLGSGIVPPDQEFSLGTELSDLGDTGGVSMGQSGSTALKIDSVAMREEDHSIQASEKSPIFSGDDLSIWHEMSKSHAPAQDSTDGIQYSIESFPGTLKVISDDPSDRKSSRFAFNSSANQQPVALDQPVASDNSYMGEQFDAVLMDGLERDLNRVTQSLKRLSLRPDSGRRA